MSIESRSKSPVLRGLFFASVVVSLLISLSALWFHRVFYNPDNLSQITTTALNQQSSRDSISRYITDKVFEDKPVLAKLAGPKLESVVSGFLASDQAKSVLSRMVEQTRIAITSKYDEDLSINLAPIKQTIVKIQSAIGVSEDERNIDSENIPDEIVIFDSSSIPNFYGLGIALLWLGPLAFAFSIGGLGNWIYRGKEYALYKRIRIAGLIVILASTLALLIGPLFEPIFVAISREAPGQTLLGNLYDGLIEPYNKQAYMLAVLGLLAVVSSYAMPVIKKRLHQ